MMWEMGPDELGRKIARGVLNVATVELFTADVPFYRNARLLKAIWPGGETLMVEIFHPVALIVLDGESDALHLANDMARIAIDEDNVVDYAKYFCGNLTGQDGQSFTVVESLKGDVLQNGKQVPDMSLKVVGRSRDGNYRLRGYMRYGETVFRVGLVVHEDGQVEMTSDAKIGERATLQ